MDGQILGATLARWLGQRDRSHFSPLGLEMEHARTGEIGHIRSADDRAVVLKLPNGADKRLPLRKLDDWVVTGARPEVAEAIFTDVYGYSRATVSVLRDRGYQVDELTPGEVGALAELLDSDAEIGARCAAAQIVSGLLLRKATYEPTLMIFQMLRDGSEPSLRRSVSKILQVSVTHPISQVLFNDRFNRDALPKVISKLDECRIFDRQTAFEYAKAHIGGMRSCSALACIVDALEGKRRSASGVESVALLLGEPAMEPTRERWNETDRKELLRLASERRIALGCSQGSTCAAER